MSDYAESVPELVELSREPTRPKERKRRLQYRAVVVLDRDEDEHVATTQTTLIVLFVGLPSLGFVLVASYLNAAVAWASGSTLEDRAALALASCCFTAILVGIPIAVAGLGRWARQVAPLAVLMWLGVFTVSAMASQGFAAHMQDEASAQYNDKRNSLKRQIADKEATLRKIAAHRPAEVVYADMAKIEARISTELDHNPYAWETDDCTTFSLSRNIGGEQRRACAGVLALRDRVAALRPEHAAAMAAVGLETGKANLQAELRNLGPDGAHDTLTKVLNTLTGGHISKSGFLYGNMAFVALLIQCCAAFGMAFTFAALDGIWRPIFERQRKDHREKRAYELSLWKDMISEENQPKDLDTIDSERDGREGVREWAALHISQDAFSRVDVVEAHKAQMTWAALNGFEVLSVTEFGRYFREWAETNGGVRLRSNGQTFYKALKIEPPKSEAPLLGAAE